jgi:hypothetical protein
VVLTLADMEGNETFDPSALGTADEVAEIRVADDAMVSRGVPERSPRYCPGLERVVV